MAAFSAVSWPDWTMAVQAAIFRSGADASLPQIFQFSSSLCARALPATARPKDTTTANHFARIEPPPRRYGNIGPAAATFPTLSPLAGRGKGEGHSVLSHALLARHR